MSWKQTTLTEALNLSIPIIQAGMAGGITSPELVATVSNLGGLGTLGAGYLSPEKIRKSIHAIREKTSRPFSVNLFIPSPHHVDTASIARMKKHLQSFEGALGVSQLEKTPNQELSFSDQVAVVLEEKVPIFSFTFGIPSADILQELKKNQTFLIGTATTVEEAVVLEERGVDVIVAQGSEAGGHRGTFQPSETLPLIGTVALVPQIVDQVSVPVIASGGIMDSRGVLASLTLGAAGVQLGSAFLTTIESNAHSQHKKALMESRDSSTMITTAFSGRPARGVHNQFIEEMNSYSGTIPPYPIQNNLTKPLRNIAAQQDNPEFMSLFGGQAASLSRIESAKELIQRIEQEVTEQLRRLSR
ncbi:nitronate monooxygenase [Marininema mesophilum]|uniref:Probable nitronate monooxygenase n=1 Tax=Marininema mesophilum TaxID=1048340 RepID=A0A1H2VCX0_9BACL|nr:DUF561 domain-containing protein [Marininema mesophilum]SDW66163.1 nitronate monooxygenase [Marininema mesophilum]